MLLGGEWSKLDPRGGARCMHYSRNNNIMYKYKNPNGEPVCIIHDICWYICTGTDVILLYTRVALCYAPPPLHHFHWQSAWNCCIIVMRLSTDPVPMSYFWRWEQYGDNPPPSWASVIIFIGLYYWFFKICMKVWNCIRVTSHHPKIG